MATITVRGTGTAYGTPDEATLGLAVESVRPTAADTAIGALLTSAVDRAGAAVDGPYWRLLPDNPAHTDASRAAAGDAKERAEALAAALGGRLGAVVAVRDSRIEPPSPRPLARMEAMAMASEPMPVEAGELTVVAQVDVEFNLEQG